MLQTLAMEALLFHSILDTAEHLIRHLNKAFA